MKNYTFYKISTTFIHRRSSILWQCRKCRIGFVTFLQSYIFTNRIQFGLYPLALLKYFKDGNSDSWKPQIGFRISNVPFGMIVICISVMLWLFKSAIIIFVFDLSYWSHYSYKCYGRQRGRTLGGLYTDVIVWFFMSIVRGLTIDFKIDTEILIYTVIFAIRCHPYDGNK